MLFISTKGEDELSLPSYEDESPLSTPSKSKFRIRRAYVPPKPRRLFTVLCAFVGLAIIFHLSSHHTTRLDANAYTQHKSPLQQPISQNETITEQQYSPWVVGAPTQSFRDNLRSDVQYITSWLSAGWNNDVMTYMNLIYLGIITDRVPIVAMFVPMHIGTDAPPILFGDIFDVPRFTRESNIPLLEWYEVKDAASETWDDIGCWDVWEAVQYGDHFAKYSSLPERLRLDISYTKAPEWIKMIPGYEHDKGASFWSLARLAFPEDRNQNLGNIHSSPLHHTRLDPDEHLLCYDYLYYVGAQVTSEYDFTYSPAWRSVGTFLHFTKSVEDVTRAYVNRALGLPQSAELPAYITIHVRHGDFKDWCWDAEKFEDCFAPLSVIARRVSEVQDELLEQRSIHVPSSRVIMTSDETNPTWWADVAARGWVRMDHDAMQTEERYGRWYPVILDAAIQASGVGFVGTDRSTFSILSRRRVLDWNNGVARTVKWGKKGADDH
ncbi:hypothetical protein BDW22DRAFT_772681 [Trametopsis cervina]|nr:hypothetical protein BDW22DRAFT_772681 [Trametopsis cervina]